MLGGVHFGGDVSVLAIDDDDVILTILSVGTNSNTKRTHLEVRGRHVELGVKEVSSSESVKGPEEENGAGSEESFTRELGRAPVDLLWWDLVELVLQAQISNSSF